MFYIASIEDHDPSTVRITVQADMSRDEAELTGTRIFNLVGGQIEEVRTIIMTDAGGIDRANLYRRNIPLLNR